MDNRLEKQRRRIRRKNRLPQRVHRRIPPPDSHRYPTQTRLRLRRLPFPLRSQSPTGSSNFNPPLEFERRPNPNPQQPLTIPPQLQAIRSEIFKNLLESDGCKAAPTDAVTLAELSHEELESLLEFLYGGDLPEEKVEKHVYSLAVAADKYEIPYLQKYCEKQMVRSLNCGSALDVLEIAEVCSLRALKERALDFVVRNMEEIVFSSGFETFALKNPHLSLQITRASLMDAKKNRANSA